MSNRSFSICLFRLFTREHVEWRDRFFNLTPSIQNGKSYLSSDSGHAQIKCSQERKQTRREGDVRVICNRLFPLFFYFHHCQFSILFRSNQTLRSFKIITEECTNDWPISDHLKLSQKQSKCVREMPMCSICAHDSEGALMASWSFRFSCYYVKWSFEWVREYERQRGIKRWIPFAENRSEKMEMAPIRADATVGTTRSVLRGNLSKMEIRPERESCTVISQKKKFKYHVMSQKVSNSINAFLSRFSTADMNLFTTEYLLTYGQYRLRKGHHEGCLLRLRYTESMTLEDVCGVGDPELKVKD